jgi:hypothetical protein
VRLDCRGEYPLGWKYLSDAVKAAAGHRCIRCHHPFDAETGRALLCDDRCDLDKGLHRRPAGENVGHRRITSKENEEWLRSLNFGVHHFDGDKSNSRWWNLMALCNSCHLKIQSGVIPERQWLFEHSEWMKPYVSGFYAFWFASLEVTREEVDRDVDHYLALGQPWLYFTPSTIAS